EVIGSTFYHRLGARCFLLSPFRPVKV
ncbi:hypothetical protein NGA_0649000, partial [Nannochloropsis gaditana CCMP526]